MLLANDPQTASTRNPGRDRVRHTLLCWDLCSSPALDVVNGVVFNRPAGTWFSPTLTMDAEDLAEHQVTDMFLDKT